jgi:ubiquinone biosynthesis protein
LKERERLGHILVLFARHGLKGLAARLGLGAARDEPLDNPGPEAVVALLRDLGPVAVKFGQILAMRSDLLEPERVTAFSKLQDRVGLPYGADAASRIRFAI